MRTPVSSVACSLTVTAMDYRPGTPPPVHHVLRPHHIDLIAIFLLVFKEFHNNLPPNFLLFIYRFLLFQVSEVCMFHVRSQSILLHQVVQPRTHQQILSILRSAPDIESPNVRNLLVALDAVVGLGYRVSSSYLIESPQAKPTHKRRSVDQLFSQFVASQTKPTNDLVIS